MSHRILKDLLEAFALSGPGRVVLTATASGTKIPEDRLIQAVTPTWGSASNILVLPTPTEGKVVLIAAASTGGVLQVHDTANVTVNNSIQLTIAPNQTVIVFCESSTSYKAIAVSDGGLVSGLGTGSGASVLRTRVATANVNAGATVLPAIPGMRYRLQDMAFIAIGGNAAGTTGVRLRGTQAASEVTLFDAKVAGLTQHTLLRAGTATNGLILNAGASFVANDANTPITIVKDGNNLTTATHIDVLLTYAIEPA
jgi:hypothetical protein